jgi:hypothetical protein
VVLSQRVKGQRVELRELRVLVREVSDPILKEICLQRQLKDKKYKYLQQLSTEIKNSNSKFIAESNNKSRAAWSVLQKSINSNKGRSLIAELHVDGEIVTDMRAIANAFNSSFITPEPVLDVPYECLGPSPPVSFFLNPIKMHEVQCYFQNMPSKKAAAAGDEIPMFLAKRIAQFVATPLAAVYNCSFFEGEFPDQLKPADVTPKFKKGDKFDVKNYRPVSVLPTFSQAA